MRMTERDEPWESYVSQEDLVGRTSDLTHTHTATIVEILDASGCVRRLKKTIHERVLNELPKGERSREAAPSFLRQAETRAHSAYACQERAKNNHCMGVRAI